MWIILHLNKRPHDFHSWVTFHVTSEAVFKFRWRTFWKIWFQFSFKFNLDESLVNGGFLVPSCQALLSSLWLILKSIQSWLNIFQPNCLTSFCFFCCYCFFQDSLPKKAVIASVTTQSGLKQFANKFHWNLTSFILTNRCKYRFLSITWTSQTQPMSTKLWLLGLKTSWRTILQFASHRLVETRKEMEKRLPQWTGWHTREHLMGECRVKWTCQPGGLGRAVVQFRYPQWVQFVVFSSPFAVSFN